MIQEEHVSISKTAEIGAGKRHGLSPATSAGRRYNMRHKIAMRLPGVSKAELLSRDQLLWHLITLHLLVTGERWLNCVQTPPCQSSWLGSRSCLTRDTVQQWGICFGKISIRTSLRCSPFTFPALYTSHPGPSHLAVTGFPCYPEVEHSYEIFCNSIKLRINYCHIVSIPRPQKYPTK